MDLNLTGKLSLAGEPGATPAPRVPQAQKVNRNGKKVLIVDDSVIILKTLATKLTLNGYDVLTATDGSDAVSTVRRERPDLILLDINFPPDVAHGGGVPWDGFLILNWLRRMDEAVNTPVIIITGESGVKHKARCLAAGVAGFFEKPLEYAPLLALMRGLLFPADGQGQEARPAAAAKRILFVDDETDWRFMATVYLRDSGYEVLTAENGSDALAQVQGAKPDVVLLDLHLSGESGLEVMQQLKQKAPHLRILLYTGMDHDEETVKLMLRQGAFQYLRKGTMGEMLEAVRNALNTGERAFALAN